MKKKCKQQKLSLGYAQKHFFGDPDILESAMDKEVRKFRTPQGLWSRLHEALNISQAFAPCYRHALEKLGK